MLKQEDYILNTLEEFEQIISVREMIENVHESANFFNLPLKTLELIRRFNNLYIQVYENDEKSPASINQLMIISRNLEELLVREN